MKRKLLCCFMAFSILASLLPMESSASPIQTGLSQNNPAAPFTEVIGNEDELAAACTAGGSYSLASDITLTQELPKITSSLTIDGNDKTISPVLTGLDELGVEQSGSTFPVFQVGSAGTLTLSRLTVMGGSYTAITVETEGRLTADNVVITRSGSPTSMGGGINNVGTVIMRNSAITRCVARYGGGFFNSGKIVMDSCSVTENRNIGGTASGGGGCENNRNGLLILNNCTFSNNQSTEIGGAINNYNATLYVLNSTITGNISYSRKAYEGGGIGMHGGDVTVINSILANNYAYSRTGKRGFVGSDIGRYSGTHATIYHSYVGNYIDVRNEAPPVIPESTINTAPDHNLFSDYRHSYLLNADGTDSILGPFLRPIITMLDNKTYGAPLGNLDDFVRDGCPLYLEYDSSANLIALAYGEAPHYLVGKSGGTLIATYQDNSFRAAGIRGALGPTGSRFYTVRLIQGQGGTAAGATVFGDSRAVGTPTRLTATPLEGNYLECWESSPDNINWTPLAGGNTLLYSGSEGEVTFLHPKFSPDGHRLTYTSSENTITQSCSHCQNSAEASLSLTEQEYLYTGQAICPAQMNTDNNWIGGPPFLAYLNNLEVGTATAIMGIDNLTVSADFQISIGKVTAVWENLNLIYGDGKSVTLTLQGVEQGDDCSLALTSPAPSAAGSHALTAQLTGTDKGKYSLTNPRATLTILPALVVFSVENNSLLWDGNSKSATISATANGLDYSDYTISYINSAGETVTPTDAGDYTIIATLTNDNYRHAGGEDGAGRPIGMLNIYTQTAPSYYRLRFDDGSGAAPAEEMLLPGTPVILPEGKALNNPGFQFAGWQSENKTYRSGDAFTMPDRNVTFTALWQPTYEISGIVQCEESPVEGVSVTLMLGTETISHTVTDSNGKYSFMNVIPGIYNLVASFDGIIITTKTTIADRNVENLDIVLPEGRTNSVVEVRPGVIPVVVGNLEKVFGQQQIYTEEDKQLVLNGGSIEVRLTVSSSQIPPELSGQTGSFTPGIALELVANKTAVDNNGDKIQGLSGLLKDTGILLEHRIPLEARLQGKSDYVLFRIHNGAVQELTTTPNEQGEYITYDAERTVITLFSRYYSTFTIAYKEKSDNSNPPNPVLPELPFTDVPEESYFYDSVKQMYESELMLGTSETSFSPYLNTSRAMLTTILWRMAGKPQAIAPSDFTDIDLKEYYGEALSWGQENQIVKGYGEGLFGPGDPITREQLAAILYRYSGVTQSGGSLAGFVDGHTASDYAIEALCWAVETGILKGKPGSLLDPKAPATRGEAAVMLTRYIHWNQQS